MTNNCIPYLTNFPKQPYQVSNIDGIEITLVDRLNQNEILQLESLRSQAYIEIKGVDILPLQIVKGEEPGNGVFMVIGKSTQDLIGYGYALTEDSNNKDVLYINTIFIKQGFRKKNIATSILRKLINEAMIVNPGGYKLLKAVVHPENNASIKLLENHGFKVCNIKTSNAVSKEAKERLEEKYELFKK